MSDGARLDREVWKLAGQALDVAPTEPPPRLYVEALNETIDMQTVRVAVLKSRVPGAVLLLEVVGSAFALGLLALYLAVLGPTRGVIQVPSTVPRRFHPIRTMR